MIINNCKKTNEKAKKDTTKTVTCPECENEREVLYYTWLDIKRDGKTGICGSCAAKKREAAKASQAVFEEKPVKKPLPVFTHGCMIRKDGPGKRCERFFECAYNDECLRVICNKPFWYGFSADCAGFVEKKREY